MLKRTKRVEIALTEEEYKTLQNLKTKARLAEWIRETVLNEKATRKPKARTADPKLLFQLNKIGVNLNQITRYCNAKKADADLVQVALALQNIEQLLRGLENAC